MTGSLARLARRTFSVAAALTLTVGGVAATASPASAATQPKYKENWSLAGGFFANPLGALNPNASPTGSNIAGCKLTPEHPRPVILVHAMGANQSLNWSSTAPYLANRGFCVYSFTYGANWFLPSVGGLKQMAPNAQELANYITRLKASTGASQVDLVGHSEGTTISAYYIKKLGGAPNVKNLVGLAPNYEGTTLYGLTKLADSLPTPLRAVLDSVCGACGDYYPGSAFNKALASDGTTWDPRVTYTNIQPGLEEVVLPNSSGQMQAPNATNYRTNTGCAKDLSDHVSIASSKRAHGIILDALDPNNTEPLPCEFNPPFLS
ncbi:esterase/lipase family protein [Dermacoccaceae bacterium W4C1]